jgi:hypothetical protein
VPVKSQSASKSEQSTGWGWRGWRFLVRQEFRFTRWLVAHGMPPSFATALLWLVKIALVVVVGYAFFWVAVVLSVVFAAVWALRHSDLDAKPAAPQWRQGFHGFGLYDEVGHRIDPFYDPNESD